MNLDNSCVEPTMSLWADLPFPLNVNVRNIHAYSVGSLCSLCSPTPFPVLHPHRDDCRCRSMILSSSDSIASSSSAASCVPRTHFTSRPSHNNNNNTRSRNRNRNRNRNGDHRQGLSLHVTTLVMTFATGVGRYCISSGRVFTLLMRWLCAHCLSQASPLSRERVHLISSRRLVQDLPAHL
jgi:hypothetical protein